MSEYNIGQTPELAIKVTAPAALPEARTVQSEAKTDIKFVPLNSVDRVISSLPDEFLALVIDKMAKNNVPGDALSTAL